MRVLIAVPAHNESASIGAVVSGIRAAAPGFDVLVVDDGSTDGTSHSLARLDAVAASHLCNLGYGRALQTAIIYGVRHEYDAIITFDGDGQHRPEDLAPLYAEFRRGGYDLLIGSRFVLNRDYSSEPWARRVGMRLFSMVIGAMTARRIYDTSSGLKVIGRRVFPALLSRPFVDFHAEAIVYLMQSGYTVGEFPVSVRPRQHGTSMYRVSDVLAYPLKVMFLTFVGAIDAKRHRHHD